MYVTGFLSKKYFCSSQSGVSAWWGNRESKNRKLAQKVWFWREKRQGDVGGEYGAKSSLLVKTDYTWGCLNVDREDLVQSKMLIISERNKQPTVGCSTEEEWAC